MFQEEGFAYNFVLFTLLAVVAIIAWYFLSGMFRIPFLPWKIIDHQRKEREAKEAVLREIAAAREVARKPSEFLPVQKSDTESVYELKEVLTVTARTDLATRQVSFAWEFRGTPKARSLEFWFTSSAEVLAREEAKALGTHPFEEEGVGSLLDLGAKLHEAKEAAERAVAEMKSDQFAAAKHALLPFAPKVTTLKWHVENVLPEGLWYIKVRVVADSVEDGFVYIANLDKSVREPASLGQTKAVERSQQERVIEKIKQTADSMAAIVQIKQAQAAGDARIDADDSIPASEKPGLKRQNQKLCEDAIREVLASGR